MLKYFFMDVAISVIVSSGLIYVFDVQNDIAVALIRFFSGWFSYGTSKRAFEK